MDLRGFRMATAIGQHPKYQGVGDYFGTGKPRHSRHRTLEQWVVFAELLAKDHSGVLPCKGWIKKNCSGLARVIRLFPKQFEHIPQEKLNVALKQCILLAEALAKENGGALPCVKWIEEHHPKLASAMWRHPDRFEHIPQEKRYRKSEDWVPFAIALAEEHGGFLPCMERIKSSYSGLNHAIRKHPHIFSGLRQEIRDRHGRLIGYRILGTSEAS